MDWKPGQSIHQRYELRRCLRDRPGHQVWLADDPLTEDRVILKRLTFGGQLNWDEVKLFEREVQVLKRLSHPQIPQLRASFSLESPVYQLCLVEDYIEAPALQAFLNREKYFSAQQIWDIATQVLDVLVYLHGQAQPILHRDIKPSNLLISAEKVVYLIDFGAVKVQRKARELPEVPTEAPTVVGTYGYTPIEQFSGHPVPASDLFALGATLIHLLSRKPPNMGSPGTLAPQIPTELQLHSQLLHWLAKMTAPVASDRFPSALQARTALQTAIAADQIYRQHAHLHSQDMPDQSRVSVHSETPDLMLTILSRWNQDTLAKSDLLLILGLSSLPLLLGGVLGVAGASTPGGIESLLMIGGGISAWWGSSTSLRNLSTVLVWCKTETLQVKRSVSGVIISAREWDWRQIQSLYSDQNFEAGCSVMLELKAHRLIAIASHLSAEDAETIVQEIERWRVKAQRP